MNCEGWSNEAGLGRSSNRRWRRQVGLAWVLPTVATGSHGLTAAARSRWARKLHGFMDSWRHGVGVGGGVVGVGEWVFLIVSLSLSVSPLYWSRLSILFSFFFFFFLGFFAFSITLFGLWCWTTDWELSVLFCFFFFFFNRLLGSWALGLGGFMALD